jgi:hypothetical protein
MPRTRDYELKKERDRLKPLLDAAWMLSDKEFQELSSLKEHEREDRAKKILMPDDINVHPFSFRTFQDVEKPHVELLRIMRNPDYFPFTCRTLFGIDLYPFQHVILKTLWNKPFPMLIGARGMGKSFILALYGMLRLLFNQGCKVAIVGAAFRQAKVIFEYMEGIWANAPVLRDLCGTERGRNNREQGPRRDVDRCEMIIGDSMAFAIPLGDGKKIRGQRANYIIADEYASIPEAIYQDVVAGFASVSASPVKAAKSEATKRLLKTLGMWTEEDNQDEEKNFRGNQSIVSGTADYAFNHFYKTFQQYKSFINSRGDKKKLEAIFQGPVPESFNWRDFAIIRIPYSLLPPGFMQEKIIARARATVHHGIYLKEYDATFPTDTDGFYKRSLIEQCVVGKHDQPILLNGQEIRFHAALSGDPLVRHVIGIDPASERDRFSIVVVALHADHRRIVHCWTTNRASHKEKVKRGIVKETDFYVYAARKVRSLMRLFNTVHIAMDSQGGGIAIEEKLHSDVREGEQPIWKLKDPPETKKPKDSDFKAGLHILEMVSFASAEWTSAANHGMRMDLQSQILLFPYFDPISLAIALEEDKAAQRIVIEDGREVARDDTLEDCVMELEDLKEELTTIVHTQTGVTGRDHWDTPETKEPGGKKGRQRKDRYSALLMASMAARQLAVVRTEPEIRAVGGFANAIYNQDAKKNRDELRMYSEGTPDWFARGGTSVLEGAVVKRGR